MPTASTPSAPSSVGMLHTNGTRPMPIAIARIAIGISRLSPTTFTTRPTSTPCTVASTTPMNAKTKPIVEVVKPNLASLKSAKRGLESRERQRHDEDTATAAAAASAGSSHGETPRGGRGSWSPSSAARDSGSRNHAAMKLARHSADANHIGVSGLTRLSRPPIAGPKMKPEAERRADHAHAARAILRRGDVGNVGLRGRDVGAGNAADDARDEEQRQRRARAPASGTTGTIPSGRTG